MSQHPHALPPLRLLLPALLGLLLIAAAPGSAAARPGAMGETIAALQSDVAELCAAVRGQRAELAAMRLAATQTELRRVREGAARAVEEMRLAERVTVLEGERRLLLAGLAAAALLALTALIAALSRPGAAAVPAAPALRRNPFRERLREVVGRLTALEQESAPPEGTKK